MGGVGVFYDCSQVHYITALLIFVTPAFFHFYTTLYLEMIF